MVAASIEPQKLAVRSDSADGNREWGTLQIATPAIVGGVLLLLFAAYFIWKRRRSEDYQQVRSKWATKIECIFVPRRKRHRVVRSSTPMALDDSMYMPGVTLDFSRRSRQSRSNSTDSQTPLTSTSYPFDFPPRKSPGHPPNRVSDSPPPILKRPTVRWWWLFGSRPQQIKSEEPGRRWHVDDPDGCSRHGHSSHGHRFAGVLEPLREDPEGEDGEDEVIRIGQNFTSVASTPVTQHFPEQARSIREMPIPQQPSGATINPGTSVLSANRGLPPSYDTQYISTEDHARLTYFGPYMALPPPVRGAGYPSPRASHGRELSSDNFLATQPPRVPSVY